MFMVNAETELLALLLLSLGTGQAGQVCTRHHAPSFGRRLWSLW